MPTVATPTPREGAAWVTGASTGIGRAVAARLARDGWTVLASARSADKLATLADECAGSKGTIVPLPCDVTDLGGTKAAIAKAKAETGPIALAILNAGTYRPDSLRTFSSTETIAQFEINVFGAFHCLEAVLPDWIEAGRGHVAIVSSVAGYRGLPRAMGYGATKAALINFAESLRLVAERHGIKVQVINPGFVRTPLTDKNDFPMPFLVEVEDAAREIVDGLASSKFEIAFPGPFVFILKRLQSLPYPLYFSLIKRQTGA